MATETDLHCVLDDEKTAAGSRREQWHMPLSEARPVRVRPRSKKAAGLVNVGVRRNWLYTQRIHPDPEVLENTIEDLIETARRS